MKVQNVVSSAAMSERNAVYVRSRAILISSGDKTGSLSGEEFSESKKLKLEHFFSTDPKIVLSAGRPG